MASGCYKNMFNGCTSLVNAPALPSMDLEYKCYSEMFRRCTSLRVAPELPATTLKKQCYSFMFSECTSLTKSPVLPATVLPSGCYESMFYKCTALSYVKAMFLEFDNGTTNWLFGVSEKGLFVKDLDLLVDDYFGPSSVPMGWNLSNGTYNSSESAYEETGTITSSSSSTSGSSIGTQSRRSQVKPYYHVVTCEINSSMS
jgi:hypothetical protein